MKHVLQRYATPLVTGLFLVSLISGLALFFHIGPSGFHGMHEWLSMVLILPFAFHLWRNWRAFLGYFRRTPMAIALALSLVAGGLFLMPLGEAGAAGRAGPPQFALAHRLLQGSATDLAPLLDTTPQAVIEALAARGITVTDPDQPLTDAATGSGADEARLAAVLTQI